MENNYRNLNAYYLQKYSIFKELSTPLFQSTPLKDFAYQRVYLGGKHLIFFTNKDYSQCFFDTVHEHCPSAHELITNLSQNQTKFLLWNEKNIAKIRDNLLFYNIAQGFTVYTRNKNYVDCYYFSANRNSPDLRNFYMNNTGKLLDFISHFNKQSKDILTNDKKILGKHTGEYILSHFKTDGCEKINNIKTSLYYFSKREFECLEALSMGYSMKFIANQFDLSPRTIEGYFDSIKRKTDIYYKDQLLDWFHKNRYTKIMTR